MDPLFFSSGKAARALGVNPDAIRRLCEAGAIQAETTPGGQWRVPRGNRTVEGGRHLPSTQANAGSHGGTANDTRTAATGVVPPHPPGNRLLLADPSDETIAADDEVVRLENEVRALGLKRQREEALDWFRQREAEEETEAADLDAEAEAYRAEEEERQHRHTFETRWLEYALTVIPGDAQGEVEVAIHREVKGRFGAARRR